jgi:hypothetical protein
MTISGLKLTAIPRGYEAQRWRVSLCVDVDLPSNPDDTLANTDWVDWPGLLNSLLANGDQLSSQFTVELTTQQGSAITVSDVRVHPPKSLPFGPATEKYWSTGWQLLFPSNIPVSPSSPAVTVETNEPQTPEASSGRLDRTFLSYDPIHVVYEAVQAALRLGQSTSQRRTADRQPNSRNPFSTPGPRRQEIEKEFSDFRFFPYENDSALEKYNAKLIHDKIFDPQALQEGRDPLVAALARIQSSRLNAQQSDLSISPDTSRPFLTAHTYLALAKYYGRSDAANVLVEPEQIATRSVSAGSIALVQALLYHTAAPRLANTGSRVRSFMERLLVLRHQPSLRKLLGLVLDLSFKADLPSGGSTGFIRVDWPTVRSVAPLRTAFEQWSEESQTFFMPGSLPLNSPDDLDRFPRGLLNLRRPLPADAPTPEASSGNRYALSVVEVSGTFHKAQQNAQKAGTSIQAHASDDEAAGLAPLRSTGLALFDRNMTTNAKARQLRDQCLDAAVNNKPCPTGSDCTCSKDLYAEDLILGIRPDIALAAAGANATSWNPLASRDTQLDFLSISGNQIKVVGTWNIPQDDGTGEAFVSSTLFNEGRDTKVPPEIFRYYNFGLGADLPLKHKPKENLSGADREMPLRTTTTARRKSFVWLRHRQNYWVRVRAAFLDGSGLTEHDLAKKDDSRIGAPTDPFGTPVQYLRTRQIGAPTVLLEEPSEIDKRHGESLTTVVKRTGGPSFNGEALSRVLVPPPMSPFEAYEHGLRMVRKRKTITCLKFDGDDKTWPAYQSNNPAPNGSDKTPGQRFPYWSGALSEYQPGDMTRTFLPDALTGNIEITISSGQYENQQVPQSVIQLEHFQKGTAWPFFRPVKLEMHRAPRHQQPVFKAVPHPKRNKVDIYARLGAKINIAAQYVADPQHFSFGQPLISALVSDSTQLDYVKRHWLLSQSMQLTLVHAVPEPVERPRFTKLALSTPVATESAVALDFEAEIHWASTGKIEIWAKWEDPVDNPGQNARPACENHEILVKSFDIPEQPGADQKSGDTLTLTRFTQRLVHAIGDFKHHRVTYGIRGVSRYTSFFPPKKASPFNWKVEDTRELSIPNRARLDPLAPLHVIPLVRREIASDHKKHTVTHYRRARYLRIYFSRAFYPSGQGELVGLLFARRQTANRDTQNSDLYGTILGDVVSVWGQAPTWKTTGGILSPLSPSDFAEIQQFKELVITVSPDADKPEDRIDLPVAVAGFTPWYDTNRELWCCDIPLPRRAVYRPLVRLALVRYQPDSCDKLHVSSHVGTPFSSAMPDRLVTVQRLKHGRHQVTMYGVAPLDSYLQVAYPDRPERTILELRVQERSLLDGSEFSWTSIPFVADEGSAKKLWEILGKPLVQQTDVATQSLIDDALDVPGLSMWQTTITIPDRKFGHSYQLSIREREDRLVESAAAASAEPVKWEKLDTDTAGRYIYLDEIPL